MDGLSGVASVLAVLQTAIDIADRTRTVCKRLKSAPSEYAALQMHLAIVHTTVLQLQRMLTSPAPNHVYGENLELFRQPLASALATLELVQRVCKDIAPIQDAISRVQWVVKYRQSVLDALSKLQATESSLCLLLQLCSLYATSSLACRCAMLTIVVQRESMETKPCEEHLDRGADEDHQVGTVSGYDVLTHLPRRSNILSTTNVLACSRNLNKFHPYKRHRAQLLVAVIPPQTTSIVIIRALPLSWTAAL